MIGPSTTYLTELEWLGVEMALCRWMGGKPAQHRLCVALLRAKGRVVTYDDLKEIVCRDASAPSRNYNALVNKSVERLRNLLADMGLSRLIVVTAAGEGVRIFPNDAALVLCAVNAHFKGRLFRQTFAEVA